MYVYKYTYLLSYTMEFPLPLSPLISTAHNCYHYLFIFHIVFPPTPILISDLLYSSFLFFLVFFVNIFYSAIWYNIRNRRGFFERYAKENEFDPLRPENWNKQSRERIMAQKVCFHQIKQKQRGISK